MSSRVVFALTRAQAETLDLLTRPGFKPIDNLTELKSLTRRYLVENHKNAHRLTVPGLAAQELVRLLALHRDEPHQT
jgi:hypothetical protein